MIIILSSKITLILFYYSEHLKSIMKPEGENKCESDTIDTVDTIDYNTLLRKYVYCADKDGDSDPSSEEVRFKLKQGLKTTRTRLNSLQSDIPEKQKCLKESNEMKLFLEEDSSSMDDERENNDFRLPIPLNSTFNDQKEIVNGVETTTDLKLVCEKNQSFLEKLGQIEISHERLLQDKDDMRLELDAEFTARGAALVDKIYTAQKLREESINNRLKRITDEKEELMKKLSRYEKDNAVDSGIETNSIGDELWINADMSLDEIVGRVVNQSQSIEINGELVLDHPKAAKKNSSKSSSEYKKIKEERDLALEQVEELKNELKEVKHQRSLLEMQHHKDEKNRLKILQNQMKAVIKDRDNAVEKTTRLEEELEHLRLQQSLKNSLSNDSSLRRQFNATLDEYKAKLDENDHELLAAQASYDELHNKYNGLVDENTKMTLYLQEALASSAEDRKRADKLERLLVALRRRKEK